MGKKGKVPESAKVSVKDKEADVEFANELNTPKNASTNEIKKGIPRRREAAPQKAQIESMQRDDKD